MIIKIEKSPLEFSSITNNFMSLNSPIKKLEKKIINVNK